MASIGNDKGGFRRILFKDGDKRKTIRLGKISKSAAESTKLKVEHLLNAKIHGSPLPNEVAAWVAELSSNDPALRSKLEAVGLLAPLVPVVEKQEAPKGPTLKEFLDDFMARNTPSKKPATRVVWQQVVDALNANLPQGIMLGDVTKGHAKQFVESMKAKGLSSTTIHKRTSFARQFFQDAVDWEKIPSNPFAKVKTQVHSKMANVFVDRPTIEAVLTKSNLTWKVIFGLARYAGLRTPSETLSLKWSDVDWERNRLAIPECKVEHHEGRGIRSCPIVPELLAILNEAWEAAPDNAEYVVDKPEYRARSLTVNGWVNVNLRTQALKILRKAGVPQWTRLFHSLRASRQTEWESEFPRHVVCAWMGNSESVAEKSYLIVTEADFQKAASQSGTPSGTLNGTARGRTTPQASSTTGGNIVVSTDALQCYAETCDSLQTTSDGGGGNRTPVP